MSQVVVLPRLVEFRSKYAYSKYLLRYVKEEGQKKGLVQFSGEDVGSADAKFEVEKSESGDGSVHIRSCYNNKYLQLVDNDNWIAPRAEKPDEDRSKRSCTLFRPTSVGGDSRTIRLTNVYLGTYLFMWRTASPYYGCVYSCNSNPEADSCDVFSVIDWQSLVLLPKYVAFKGDNDKFLSPIWYEGHSYLQFSESKADDLMVVGNEIVRITSDGNIRIRNMFRDRYWCLSPNWIWADSTNSSNNDTLFEPIKCSNDTIALRNMANKLFCIRLSTEGKINCLNAGSSTINISTAKFKVSELIISRKIDNIRFRLMDSRVYDEKMLVMVSSTYTNRGNSTQEQTIQLSYTNKRSSSWNNSLSLTTSVEATITAGIPFIEEGKVTVGAESSAQHAWGEIVESEENVTISYKVSIPPRTKVTVRTVTTRGVCDVPFNYDQRDVLYTGKTVVTNMDDGVFTGVNNYSFYTEEKEEPLDNNNRGRTATGFRRVAKVSRTGVITRLK